MSADNANLESLVSRIDERTENMMKKLEDHCAWKSEASNDLAVLKQSKLPERVNDLEKWRSYICGAMFVLSLIFTVALALIKYSIGGN